MHFIQLIILHIILQTSIEYDHVELLFFEYVQKGGVINLVE